MDVATETASTKNMFILILGSALGNFLEFYSFALIGIFHRQVSNAFFPPTSDSTVSLLQSFSLYGVALITRPIGGVLFGYFGDKHGRINALRLSILFMSVPTVFIGCTPPFSMIGYWSTALVFTFRFIQGFSAGGEFASATTYIREQSPPNRTGLYLTLTWVLSMGEILVLLERKLLIRVLTTSAFNSYGFRIPFLFSLFIGLAAIFMRYLLPQSQEFQAIHDNDMILSNPLRHAIKHKRYEILIISLSQTVPVMFYQLYTQWIPAYLFTIKNDPYSYDVLLISTMLYMTMALLLGWLCDKYSVYSLSMYGGLSGLVIITTSFLFMGNTQDAMLLSALQLLQVFAIVCFMIPFFVWGALYLKDPRTRNTVYGFGYNIGIALFISYSFDICTALQSLHTVFGGLYVALFCDIVLIIGMTAVYYGNRNKNKYTMIKTDTETDLMTDTDD